MGIRIIFDFHHFDSFSKNTNKLLRAETFVIFVNFAHSSKVPVLKNSQMASNGHEIFKDAHSQKRLKNTKSWFCVKNLDQLKNIICVKDIPLVHTIFE